VAVDRSYVFHVDHLAVDILWDVEVVGFGKAIGPRAPTCPTCPRVHVTRDAGMSRVRMSKTILFDLELKEVSC
jgi:hypothetical protein